jgi:hypothetical protein
MPSLKVTFDTNVLKGAVTPDLCAGEPEHAAYAAVNKALKSGQISGYFSEAVFALDALGREDKVDVVGGARMESQSYATGPSSITISVGPRWRRTPVNQQFLDRIQAALALGLRALIGPRHMAGSLSVQSFGESFYEPYASVEELIARGEKANEVDAALAKRGLGRASAVCLGLEYSKRDDATGEWWPQGIGRARGKAERKKVHEAINEWADGEAIAAHVGHGHDLFCTNDRGSGAGQQSALHPKNRVWLHDTYGVEFVTISELARRVTP